MSEETNNQDTQKREMSPEEMEQARQNLIKFYTTQNEVLELQDKFHKMKADIAENDARELMWTIRKAQMLQGPPTPNAEGNGEGDGPKKRTLKTD
jgi:hypothetical protein